MQNFYTYIFRQCFPEFFCIIRYIFRIQPFTFFNHGADYISLPSCMDLFFYKRIRFRTIGCSYYTVFDRETFGRKFIDNGNIQISIQNNCQRSWNWCRTHNQNMWRIPPGCQCFSLPNTKSVLFICNHKTKILIFYFFLNQSMGSNNNINFSVCNLLIDLPFLFRCCRSGQKYRTTGSNLLFFHQIQKSLIMLIRKYFCRHHQSTLKTILCRKYHRKKCNHRFSTSDISLYQP